MNKTPLFVLIISAFIVFAFLDVFEDYRKPIRPIANSHIMDRSWWPTALSYVNDILRQDDPIHYVDGRLEYVEKESEKTLRVEEVREIRMENDDYTTIYVDGVKYHLPFDWCWGLVERIPVDGDPDLK